jgi:Cu-Zn family superoxide dismutase
MRALKLLTAALAVLPTFTLSQELKAFAELINQKGEKVGKAELIQTNSGVLIKLDVKGLPPNAELALHIHELGKCDPPDFMSAKGHLIPSTENMGS